MKLQSLLLGSALVLGLSAGAHDHKHEKGHSHGKHVHGEGRMDVAFEALKGEIDFKISADVVLGSENAPKGAKAKAEEKMKLDNLVAKFKESVKFEGATCTWNKVEVDVDRHKVGKVEHAEIEVEADVTCDKSLKGGKFVVDLRAHYPSLNKIEVQIVTPELQKGGVIDAKTNSIDLN
ncbi:MAG: DUF2796 domain-containing protein [Bdellovibrionaceae bacterium]|nr:DUF2796 domain-containing protein [Pseudobdellovibrionaceae bacterium]